MSSEHPWFAVHDEVLNDNKLARIRRASRQPRLVVIGAWTALLALSNQAPVRGVLLIREDRPLTTQEIFDEWDMDGGEGQVLLDAFVDQGLVAFDVDEWVICNWEKRQPRLDKSTERVRQHRARKAAALGGNHVTPETFQDVTGVTNETLRNGIEREEELERELRDRESEGGVGEGDDLYSFERTLDAIVSDGLKPEAGTRPRPNSDDSALNAIWGCLLNLCDDNENHARLVAVVADDLAEKLEWLKPFPRGERDRQTALDDWWRPIHRALKARAWDNEATVTAMVAAAHSLHQRQMSPSKPAGLMGELSKQKTRSSRASPEPATAGGGQKARGTDALRERINQKRGTNGRGNGTG